MSAPKRAAPDPAMRRYPGRTDGANARRRYVSINDTAEYLGVTERTVRQMISDGRLIGYRMGKRFIRLNLDEIDTAMEPFGGAAR